LHGVLLLLLLLDELLANPICDVLLVLIVLAIVNVVELLIIAKEQVANNRFDDIGTNGELKRVNIQVEVMVEHVGELDAPNKILLLLINRQALIFHPRRHVLPLMMVAVLEWNERLHEVLDVVALLALTARHPDLNDVAAFVQAEQAADDHVAITSC
jgi:hypothetical protein